MPNTTETPPVLTGWRSAGHCVLEVTPAYRQAFLYRVKMAYSNPQPRKGCSRQMVKGPLWPPPAQLQASLGWKWWEVEGVTGLKWTLILLTAVPKFLAVLLLLLLISYTLLKILQGPRPWLRAILLHLVSSVLQGSSCWREESENSSYCPLCQKSHPAYYLLCGGRISPGYETVGDTPCIPRRRETVPLCWNLTATQRTWALSESSGVPVSIRSHGSQGFVNCKVL